ncbi:hypothetical protein CLAFUW4_10923 [Fulvia fulva]|uniref:F-box domain-containing protein n=1 Tax=Passalora fulva TaxID=5499 RepID=A0A9Q8PCL4_PASFU|nr:uncharacterized protein CLAFUR5_09965 [Fulvia fulva]KAK4619526.1 hypothetical protein CLAFUR4_10928 [Fulvia fulva]KAK4620586.1 hypothetical protein CLAFUR0_10935 [Fulvia fulva]UJO19955.1 hypothetical protein CLAFUR5_09965 [Fulvia fulva]WPV16917.1 hypothetical protein CLAFUW4_10923 [Fulvia fulva]WPV31956.1 hypothetical protein CLAFUW7_10921 [Fulvia fulva]
MASASSESALASVINTAELLENILLHLPPADVVRSRQVHSIWKEAIAASPVLRQHIFLDPKPLKELIFFDGEPGSFSSGSCRLSHNLKDLSEGGHRVISLHPALEKIDAVGLSCFDSTHKSVSFSLDLRRLYKSAPGEWRHMSATNPLVPRVIVAVGGEPVYIVSTREGVTMGDLFDKVMELDDGLLRYSTRIWGEVPQCVSDDSGWVIQARKAARAEKYDSSRTSENAPSAVSLQGGGEWEAFGVEEFGVDEFEADEFGSFDLEDDGYYDEYTEGY